MKNRDKDNEKILLSKRIFKKIRHLFILLTKINLKFVLTGLKPTTSFFPGTP